VGVPQGQAAAGPLLQDRDLFRGARQGPGRLRWQRRAAVVVADAAVREFARGRVSFPHAWGVIARPAPTPGPIALGTMAVPTQHRNPLTNRSQETICVGAVRPP